MQDGSLAPLCGRLYSTRVCSSSLQLVSSYRRTRLMKIVRGFLVRNGKGATTGWIESIHLCTLLLIATHSYPSSPLPCSLQVTVWFRPRTPHKVRTATRRPMAPVVLLGAWTATPKILRSSYIAISSTYPAYSLRRNVCAAVF